MRQLEGDYDERVVAKSKPVRNLVSRSHASLEKNGATCCQDSHKDLRKSDAMTNSRESFGFQIENQHGIVHDIGKNPKHVLVTKRQTFGLMTSTWRRKKNATFFLPIQCHSENK